MRGIKADTISERWGKTLLFKFMNLVRSRLSPEVKRNMSEQSRVNFRNSIKMSFFIQPLCFSLFPALFTNQPNWLVGYGEVALQNPSICCL